MFQPGQPPISDATLLDLIGHWEGQVIGRLFHPEGDLYRYEHHVTCATGAIGTCVLTAWETARHDDGRYALMADSQGNPIRDTAGLQTTLSLVPRGRLFFDLEFTNTLGHQGTGALMMSPDKDGFGLYLCPPENDDMKACEYGLFERR
ncbi:hypothetical protein LRB11_01425 [Ectothiorhodospira haloalkaliphila]|uniref:hypothetical protein n=1 Tax=Ectothiorhodospira haloalkaliphila TaxID=421628 RepID=UPI001EE7D71A|nr:hypothetical protein [Ectothiorhodospira haloalkaliphila]MCG5523590.1 hypothetical protein [Ectothiorhodospira haloalkaliphila]